jgi:hypothetical protein
MENEMKSLVSKLSLAQKHLLEAKRLLEEYREGGIAAEQEVVVARNAVHELKDRIAALAGEMK